MVGLGVGEIIGATLLGHVHDIFSRKVTIISNMVSSVIAFVLVLGYSARYEFSLVFGFIMTFFWGIQDAGIGVCT